MPVKYRYTKAELEGNRFGLWLARLFGVKPKLVKYDLDAEEAEEMGVATDAPPKMELPPGLNNGNDD